MAANIWAIVLLVALTAISVTIVRMFKKPGQMSVIEAQSMDMSTMQPPPGAVPVELTRAHREPIEGTVTYTGTVQAYEDEDVYPRITGRIVQMPVYPGDLVKKGQLLVVLDNRQNSEYEARLKAAVEARNAAMHKAGVSKQEFKQKQYLYNAAMDAEKQAARALDEAQADLGYWSPEIKRQEALLKQQVVSQEEYDAELARFRTAQAKVAQARARLSQARNEKIAAEAAFEAEVHHIGHAFSEARQAEAAMKEASIIEAYTRILARDEGVVTKRLISPGVVVNPGMPILKVAHLHKVRVQAEVAGSDLDKVHLGSPVSIRLSADSQRAINGRVTSIFPAADPTSRTSIVEALVDNIEPVGTGSDTASPTSTARSETPERLSTARMYRLLPGQYVVMTISTGTSTGIAIPTSAVIWREGRPQVWKVVRRGQASAPVDYTCLMHREVHADKPGKCPKCGMDLEPSKKTGPATVALQDVSIGVSNADKSEVTSGLSQGDEVVSAGYADLQPGQAVAGTHWGTTGPVSLPTAAEAGGSHEEGHRH
jgi:multidrug efflux pump subunit AcrA (membrane-fusion protein)